MVISSIDESVSHPPALFVCEAESAGGATTALLLAAARFTAGATEAAAAAAGGAPERTTGVSLALASALCCNFCFHLSALFLQVAGE